MCLIGLALQAHPDIPLLIAANRDERHDRPTAPAAIWDDAPEVLAGRDLRGGGTWLGVTRSGRVAALTNYRAPRYMTPSDGPSRGLLVRDFLTGDGDAAAFGARLRAERERYAGYNLLFGSADELWCYESEVDRLARVSPGIHALSNHLLDTPWPKVERLKAGIADILRAEPPDIWALHEVLGDRWPAPDGELPDTGVGLELERLLSPPFIAGEQYGTRAVTVVTIDRRGEIVFDEGRFGPGGLYAGGARFHVREAGVTYEPEVGELEEINS